MVVHHADCLQVAVDYHATDEFEAKSLHVLADYIGPRRIFLIGQE
jgi:hypothetical protein